MRYFWMAFTTMTLGLSLSFYFLKRPSTQSSKSLDAYWIEAGLKGDELKNLVTDANCLVEEKNYLSCANAVNAIAERFDHLVTPEGIIREISEADIPKRLTEKSKLTDWKLAYRDKKLISFEHILTKFGELGFLGPQAASAIAAGINAFLSVLKDPHTYIIPLALYEEVVNSNESRQQGIGAIFRRESDALLVKKVFEGSAAAQAGLRKGDRVVAINDLKVKTLMPSKTSELLKMKNDTRMILQVTRAHAFLNLELTKSDKSFPAFKSQIIHRKHNRVGLLTIHKFSKEICKSVKSEIMQLQQESISGLMLDLRDNPGGQVDEAACVINLFVARGKLLFETKYLNEDRFPDKYTSTDKPIYAGPLVVLINSGSASAAEIVAGSLKDLQRATLVGERTFGKGTFQDGSIWNSNPKIALFQTGGFYYFPSGWTPQLMGLQPDIKVSFANTESLREEDQFFSPVIPTEIAFNPNSLNWVLEKPCSSEIDFLSDSVTLMEDPQLMQAQSWLECGVNYARNSTL